PPLPPDVRHGARAVHPRGAERGRHDHRRPSVRGRDPGRGPEHPTAPHPGRDRPDQGASGAPGLAGAIGYLPLCIARHTRSGRSGMSRWRTPKGFNASTTALTSAGVEPMVAASPMPLAPSGLNGEVVTVWSVTKNGRSSARGTA